MKLKAGVLGAGHLGKIHLRLLAQSEKYELVGFYDSDANNAQQVSETFSYHRFDTMEELIAACDVVDVVTPTLHHYECAEKIIKAGKHLFIEKPIATTVEEAEKMMNVYATFVENFMAVPVIKGVKTESERFAGADDTYCIEALMQDGKALQAGTSHFLGQNFAKAFEVKYVSKEGKQDYVWATSWGVSTRLMGALIMTHSDDNGLVLPPNLAPIQVVIVPIYKGAAQLENVRERITPLMEELKKQGISVKFDDRDTQSPGFKFNEYELKGVPVRLAVGQRDLENHTFEVARRDTLTKETISADAIVAHIQQLLAEIQENLYKKALAYRDTHITEVNSYDEFKELLETKGGFFAAHWDGTAETEAKIKEETKATIRCIPLNGKEEAGVCMYSGKPSARRVLFAKAY